MSNMLLKTIIGMSSETGSTELPKGSGTKSDPYNWYKILDSNNKVNFWNDEDAINNVKDMMDDYFYDVIRDEKGITIPSNIMDQIIEKVLFVERKRRNH